MLVIIHIGTDNLFGVVRTNLYTFAAVDTAAFKDNGFAVSHPDCLSRATLYTVCATATFIYVEAH
jgi:hypothetical protein